MLKIKNLFSGYGKNKVIQGVDFECNPGEIVAIIGPNGSGKSTLLKSVFNLCNVFSGEILWKDKNITRSKTHNRIKDGISFVPQGKMIFKDLTIEENLEMGAFIFNNKDFVRTNIEKMYDKFTFLRERRKCYGDSLSGGQQQLLALARALIQNPQLLLLDEPSLGLSPKAMKEIFQKIKEINKEGVSIIIVEQNAKAAVELADRTYILENGKIALVGGKEILKNKKVKEIYFGGKK